MPSPHQPVPLAAAAAEGPPASASLLDAVVELLPIGVIVAESPSRRLLAVNGYARRTLRAGLDSDAVAGLARLEMRRADGTPVPERDLPLVRALERGETTEGEILVHERSDGSRRVLAISAFPVGGDDGRPAAAAMLLEDVSASEGRRRAERDFATNAAHELRTPVAAIASAVEVLQAGAKADEELRDLFLGHIERESTRLQRLSRALLLLARADSHGERPRLAIVPLHPLLHDVAGAVVPASGVRVSVRCGHDLAVVAAPDLLEQALVNVVGNAARFTEAGRIVVAGIAKGDVARIEVRDTGPGIAAEDVGRVFERFYRGRSDSGGFGLGLAIARHAVEASGGTIALESAPGVGTTVTIRVPLARLVSGAPSPGPERPPSRTAASRRAR